MDFEDGFTYRGERYRKKYIDAFQELYRTVENANNALGSADQPHVHYPSPKSPANRKFGGKNGS